MNNTHRVIVCEKHRTILSQCRCPGPKTIKTVPCPGEDTCSRIRFTVG